MSPNLNIKAIDGLPAGEIHLAIAQSELKTVGLMEIKLNEHREVIEERLDNQDEKLEAMQEDLTALVGTDKVPGLVSRNTDLLQGLVEKHETWHEQDTEFRSAITLQVSQLAENHTVIAKDVRSIKWFVTACSALGRFGKSTLTAAKESPSAYKGIGLGTILWIAIVQFLHVVWPTLIVLLHHFIGR